MNLDNIENELKNISSKINKETFIYDFLLAYGLPKSSINRLKKGDYNQSKIDGEVIWTKKIYFKPVSKDEDVHDIIDNISKNSVIDKQKIRFVIVTDFKIFLSKDIKSDDTLDIEISKLSESLNFFLPLIGREKIVFDKENPADIKAANQMGKLYDQIIRDNKNYDLKKYRDHLNLFFTRLLFLYYADDSEIFKKNQFLRALSEFTEKDGSDLNIFFNNLFFVLNSSERSTTQSYLKDFPYVNGNLFHGKIVLPKFSKTTRQMILDGASLDWHMINPDILGSMLQAVVSPEEREEDEMHYTSVSNILKVIGPLFLDNLKERIDESGNNEKKLKKILRHIYDLKIFDPACGSGNFLIISYKQLCLLEIDIFEKLLKIEPEEWRMSLSGISLNQFYGIEKSHYAAETSKLSLWLAEHQMNMLFKNVFGRIKPSLPLQETGNILCDNSAKVDWNSFCSFDKNTSHIYLVGNPPFKGSRKQNIDQKLDSSNVLKHIKGYKRLDYVSIWFVKAKNYIQKNENSSCSFVSTDSICQGEHVSLLWPEILKSLEIIFAVKTFKWSNNARDKAVVFCCIIGLSKPNKQKKILIDGSKLTKVDFISPYLTSKKFVNIPARQKPFIKNIPDMIYGNMPLEGGFLKLNLDEYNKIKSEDPKAVKFIRPLIGANEFINGTKRWCIWIDDSDLSEALNIKEIKKRIELVKEFRKNGGNVAKTLVKRSHQFRFRNQAKKNFILIPQHSTSVRDYLPIGFFENKFISLHSAQIIYDPPLFLFAILSSKTHMLWSKYVGGKLGTGVRYSSNLCFNTFPAEDFNENQIKRLEDSAFKIIEEREKYSELPISKLYGNVMPVSLKSAHRFNDNVVDIILFEKENLNDDDIISLLLEKYEKYTQNLKKELF